MWSGRRRWREGGSAPWSERRRLPGPRRQRGSRRARARGGEGPGIEASSVPHLASAGSGGRAPRSDGLERRGVSRAAASRPVGRRHGAEADGPRLPDAALSRHRRERATPDAGHRPGDRRDRRFPGRDRSRLSQHASPGRRDRVRRRAHRDVLAAAGHVCRDQDGRRRAAGREAAPPERSARPAACHRRAQDGALDRQGRGGADRGPGRAEPAVRPHPAGQAHERPAGRRHRPRRRDQRPSPPGHRRPAHRTAGRVNPPATPVMRQYREAKEKHPEGILLFRLGDFYEIFFEDAQVAAPIMGVQLTSRPLGKTGRAPMCGVPHHAWQSYVGKLLRAGHKVVICDQIEAASKNKIVRRDVTRVLTSGTVVEDAYLEPSRPNYLVAAWARGAEAGIAACEVSTGELLLCQLATDRLQSELERLAPAELLAPPEVDEYRFDPVRGQQRLKDLLGIAFPASVGAQDAPLAVGAAGVVLDYLRQNQTRVVPGSFTVRTYSPDLTMPLDAATVRNLELPALVTLMDRTSTPLGARQLRAWLGAPLRDAESIQLRLAAVDELVSAPGLRESLQSALKPIGDLERLVSRAAQGRATARELVALRRSLEAIPAVQDALGACSALMTRELGAEVGGAPELAGTLARALVEDPPSHIREGGVIRAGYDPDLDAISDASRSARDWIGRLEPVERRH